MRRGHRHGGFTLLELLVALSVLALLALLSWRGIDALLRTRQTVEHTSQALLGWQTALAQWQTDLDAWAAAFDEGTDGVPRWSVAADTVRLVRRAPVADHDVSGWTVVAWAATDGGTRWSRWQSPPVADRGQLALLWQTAPQRVHTEGVRTVAISAWVLQVWRDGVWQAATGDAAPAAARLMLTPAPAQPLTGPLSVAWVAPWVAGGKQ